MRRGWSTSAVVLLSVLLTSCTSGGGLTATSTASVTVSPNEAQTSSPTTPTVIATSAAGISVGSTTRARSLAATRLAVSTLGWRLPTPLSRMVALAAPGGGIELAGGLLNGDHSSARVLHVDLATGAVTDDGTLATGVHDAAGAVLGGSSFVYAGGAATEVSGIQRLTPGGPATQVGRLPEPRSDLVVVVAAGKVVVLGGYNGSATLADVLVSSDGVHFTVLARLPVPVRYPAVVVRGAEIYLYGGDVAKRPTDVIQRISLSGDRNVVGHLPRPTGHAAAMVLGGAVWLAGGSTPAGTSYRIYRSLDGVTFAPAGRLPGPRADMGVVVAGGVGYLIGGETPARTSSVVVAAACPVTRRRAAAVLLLLCTVLPAARAMARRRAPERGTCDQRPGGGGRGDQRPAGHATGADGPACLRPTCLRPACLRPSRDRPACAAAPRCPGLPGMPQVLDPSNIYAADGPDDLAPATRGALSRIYVPNGISDTVDVIDPATYKVVKVLKVGGCRSTSCRRGT